MNTMNLGFPIHHICRLCNEAIHGDHLLVCKRSISGARITLWHDPMVHAWARVVRRLGLRYRVEQEGTLCFQPTRPDLVVLADASSGSQSQILTDVRTCPCFSSRALTKSPTQPGHAAKLGEAEKNNKFAPQAIAQGDRFFPLCIEDGGRLGKQSLELLVHLCERKKASGDSSFNHHAFLKFARTELHLTSLKAIAHVIQQNASRMIPDSHLRFARRRPGPSHRLPCPYHPRPKGSVLPRLRATPASSLPPWVRSLRSPPRPRPLATTGVDNRIIAEVAPHI